jgi:hypothetical protein
VSVANKKIKPWILFSNKTGEETKLKMQDF